MNEQKEGHPIRTKQRPLSKGRKTSKLVEPKVALPEAVPGERWGEDISEETIAELAQMELNYVLTPEWVIVDEWGAISAQEEQPNQSGLSPGHKAWLRRTYQNNIKAGKAPYWGVTIRTLHEVIWIMHERGWSGELLTREPADFSGADFLGADLAGVHLHAANLSNAILIEADLRGADLSGANLSGAVLDRADLSGALIYGARLDRASLTKAILTDANLCFSKLRRAFLNEADLSGTLLESADLTGTGLIQAKLSNSELVNAVLYGTILEETDLRNANLIGARMDASTALINTIFDTHTRLCDVGWNGVSLTQTHWHHLPTLGDEAIIDLNTDPQNRLRACRVGVRAYRQLAVALEEQGLSEDAARFAYRAHLLQRRAQGMDLPFLQWKAWQWLLTALHGVLWPLSLLLGGMFNFLKRFPWLSRLAGSMKKFLIYIGSLLLEGIAGYGYKPGRTLFWYLTMLLSFTGLYHFYGHLPLQEPIFRTFPC
jgi:uncharacterized protein YjbI with pentapeptide repeats